MSATGNDELDRWVAAQLERQARFVHESGLIEHRKVRVALSWIAPMQICIGKIVSAHNKAQAYWAISGRNVPTDAFDVKLAQTPRDAARHFALKWQMKAARLESDSKDGLPEVAAGLSQTAEALYALTLNDDQWALRE